MNDGVRLLAAPIILGGMVGALYVTGPPPAHTGGFGEPTCAACHFDASIDEPGGSVSLRGVPHSYEPGKEYEIEGVLVRPGLQRAGFQLAARSDSGVHAGRQVGRLLTAHPGASIDSLGGVQYARHSEAGTAPSWPDSTVWQVIWLAPDAGAGPVAFHVAANAANGDDSEFGDNIYLGTATTTLR